MEPLDRLGADSVKAAVEALLLVSPDPVAGVDVARALGITPGEAVEALSDLSAEYEDAGRGFQLRQVAGGWRLFTHPAYHEVVEGWVLSWDTRKLSQAALETLAVIAYHQPVTREGVKAVRGVNSEGVISSLVDKGLVREVGRSRDLGQAILYGTTTAFLERFGLRSIKDLPPLEDFAPDEESRAYIRERLSGRPAAVPDAEELQEERGAAEESLQEAVLLEADAERREAAELQDLSEYEGVSWEPEDGEPEKDDARDGEPESADPSAADSKGADAAGADAVPDPACPAPGAPEDAR